MTAPEERYLTLGIGSHIGPALEGVEQCAVCGWDLAIHIVLTGKRIGQWEIVVTHDPACSVINIIPDDLSGLAGA
jgi:hypothetical protein